MSPAVVGPHGLQPERTALSWQRTAISANLTVVPLLLVELRQGHWALGLASAVAGLVITALVLLLLRRLGRLKGRRSALSPWPDMVGVCVSTVVLALLGLGTAVAVLVQR